MMSHFTISAIVAGPLVAATVLTAQAGGYAAAPVVPAASAVADWEGAYVGAGLGLAFGGDDKVVLHDNGSQTPELGNFRLAGPNLALRAGYSWQRGDWVFGPELGFEGGDVKDDFSKVISGDRVSGETKLKHALALRFKTGYLLNPETLVYGIAGLSRAKFDYSVAMPNAADSIDDSFSRTGYVLGFGVERRLTEKLSITGEYEYANYGKEHLRNAAGVTTPATPKFSNVRIGLNYRF